MNGRALIVNADLGAPSGRVSIALADGVIAEIGARRRPTAGEQLIDAAGGAVIAGLHDHHVHLAASAAALESIDVGPAATSGPQEFAAALRHAHAALPPGSWLRAVGYHEAVAGRLDRTVLDAIVVDRPVRVQHRSGIEWVLNSNAVERTRLDTRADPGVERRGDGAPTGRLIRMDDWLRSVVDPVPLDFSRLAREAARRGVTGFTDATPAADARSLDLLADARRAGAIPQRITAMTAPGLALPVWPDRPGPLRAGPVKLILDDDRLPSLDHLVATIASAHGQDRSIAIHCVTRAQSVLAVAALAQAGPRGGDRLEHGSVLPHDLLPALRATGATVVTNPGFLADRGDDYLRDVDPRDQQALYPVAGLLAAGIPVAAGTDAPHGPLDPWRAIRAAMLRETGSGAVIGAAERVGLPEALALFTGLAAAPGSPRPLAVGQPGDLCVLAVPHRDLDRAVLDHDADCVDLVVATLIGGRPIDD